MTMTIAEAQTLLMYHSFTHQDLDHPKMEKGFLGMLRPFRGILYEENFHEVMAALWALRHILRNSDRLDKPTISALWGICHLARSWGLEPDGMLRRNNLINAADIAKLGHWVDTISYTAMMLLDGADDETAFAEYNHP